jgi:hypothetical protein
LNLGHGTAGTLGRRRLVAVVGVLALAIVVAVGISVNADAKKKKSKANVFSATKTVNAPIPDAVAGTASTPLTSTITVPKKFKGKVVGDVDVTGIQTTGDTETAAGNLGAKLIAPNGRTLPLFRAVGGQSLGPWTLDDDTKTSICSAPPGIVCSNPNQSLYQPFAGTSNLAYNDGPAFVPLAAFNGVPMKGTWTFKIIDGVPAGGMDSGTSVFNRWGLKITAAKPVT